MPTEVHNQLLDRHSFLFNPSQNGGESISLNTEYRTCAYPEQPGFYTSHELELNSYGAVATISFPMEITPKMLRKLADQLEKKREKIAKTVKKARAKLAKSAENV